MTVLSSANIIDKLYVSDPRDPNRLFITPTPKRTEIKDASVDLMQKYLGVTVEKC